MSNEGMSNRPTTLALSWAAMHRDTILLAELLRDKGPFTGIIAITRGGMIPAAIVAGELSVRLIETVCIASYEDRTQGGLHILKAIPGNGAGWLVIDDLVDSGATASAVRAMLPAAHLATLYAKPQGLALVDTHVAAIPQGTWVVFPWEAPPPEA
jgi:xanthine phosphoribosyltransferase